MDVLLVMAMTLDGKIARGPDQFIDWTGKEDKQHFAKITKEAGVVIMGSKTYDTIGKPLPQRNNIVLTRHLRESQFKNVEFTCKSAHEIIEDLKQQGYRKVVVAGGSATNTYFEKEITQVYITVVPKMFGCGLGVFCRPLNLDLDLITSSQLGTNGHMLLHYKVNRG